MKTIRILGGGIAGLTAAINLKRAGFAVEVHEKKDFCGKHTNNFQFIENWTCNDDVLDMLKDMQIKTDFYIKPRYSQEVLSPLGKKYVGTSDKPVTYLVKRGYAKDTVNKSLESQSQQLGVKLFFNSTLKDQEADIIATGVKKPTFIATGILFSCRLPDKSTLLFDSNLAQKFYSYCVVNDNVGEITCVNPVDINNHQEKLESATKRFEDILSIRIKDIGQRFSAPLSFEYTNQARINNQYFVGEAAGFQDCLLGFGLLYPFKSGYLSARSIIEELDYQHLLDNEILKPIKISAANRGLFEKLSNQRYEKLIHLLNTRNAIVRYFLGGDDLRLILKKVYNHSLSIVLRPLLFW